MKTQETTTHLQTTARLSRSKIRATIFLRAAKSFGAEERKLRCRQRPTRLANLTFVRVKKKREGSLPDWIGFGRLSCKSVARDVLTWVTVPITRSRRELRQCQNARGFDSDALRGYPVAPRLRASGSEQPKLTNSGEPQDNTFTQ